MQLQKNGRIGMRENFTMEKKVAGSLKHVINGRPVNTEIKRALYDSIIVPKLMYASETA